MFSCCLKLFGQIYISIRIFENVADENLGAFREKTPDHSLAPRRFRILQKRRKKGELKRRLK